MRNKYSIEFEKEMIELAPYKTLEQLWNVAVEK